MRIRYHVAVDNRLQRSVVEVGQMPWPLARRIVHFVRPEDGSPMRDLVTALWQEQIHTGDYHNVIEPAREAELERLFIAELIRTKDQPAPMQDANGAWRRDSGDVLDKCVDTEARPSRQPSNT